MIIKVKKDGKVFVDSKEIKNEEINSDFLEKIINESLNNNVTYDLDEDKTIPMVKLFSDFEQLCEEGSDFRKSIEEIENDIKNAKENDFDEIVDNELNENSLENE